MRYSDLTLNRNLVGGSGAGAQPFRGEMSVSTYGLGVNALANKALTTKPAHAWDASHVAIKGITPWPLVSAGASTG